MSSRSLLFQLIECTKSTCNSCCNPLVIAKIIYHLCSESKQFLKVIFVSIISHSPHNNRTGYIISDYYFCVLDEKTKSKEVRSVALGLGNCWCDQNGLNFQSLTLLLHSICGLNREVSVPFRQLSSL